MVLIRRDRAINIIVIKVLWAALLAAEELMKTLDANDGMKLFPWKARFAPWCG